AALRGPPPKTVRPQVHRSQPRHRAAAVRSRASVGRGGMKSAADAACLTAEGDPLPGIAHRVLDVIPGAAAVFLPFPPGARVVLDVAPPMSVIPHRALGAV